MARKVKCQDSGQYSTSDVAYKAANGKYYTSKKVYDKLNEDKKYREECISLIYSYLGYESFMKIPTFFYKKLKDWEPYGYDVVLMCIQDNKNSIEWALSNKTFNQESAKIMYICAILENHMTDSLKKCREMERVKIVEKQRNNNSIEPIIDIDDVWIKKTNNNVSDLLGDI